MNPRDVLAWLPTLVAVVFTIVLLLMLLVPQFRTGPLRRSLIRWRHQTAERQGLEIIVSTLVVGVIFLLVSLITTGKIESSLVAWGMALTLLGWAALLLRPNHAAR